MAHEKHDTHKTQSDGSVKKEKDKSVKDLINQKKASMKTIKQQLKPQKPKKNQPPPRDDKPEIPKPIPVEKIGVGKPLKKEEKAHLAEYTVAPGDSLSKIAQHFYNDMMKWGVIYEANKKVIGDNPDRIEVGQVLKIPKEAG